jgi:hypothetical protein
MTANRRSPRGGASAWPLLALCVALVLGCVAPAGAQGSQSDLLGPARRARPYLREGARGPAVRALQRALTQLNLPLRADGDFGPLTAGSVRAFQRREGLSADGIVGPLTLRALDAALARQRGPRPPTRAPSPRPAEGGLVGALGDGFPTSRQNNPGGRAIFADARTLTGSAREVFFLGQIQGRAVPRFMSSFQKVTLRGRDGSGRDHVLEVWVSPDYLAVGTDADFVRVPLTPGSAQRVCDRNRSLLPTRKLVDAIYRQARVKLNPQPLPPGRAMTKTDYFKRHNDEIERQLRRTRVPLSALKAGHKKDLVITPRLQARRGRVAIYGWHRPGGKAIQPLSTVHTSSYVDYSHGVRLVLDAVRLDGRVHSAAAILRDPVLHPLLSDEGRFTSTRADR